MTEEHDKKTEMELKSESVYKKVFYTVLLITVLYLVIIMAVTG